MLHKVPVSIPAVVYFLSAISSLDNCYLWFHFIIFVETNLRFMKAKSKSMVEKKTGEKYASKAAMVKHEKKEGKKEMVKEYGMKAALAKMKKK